MRTADAAHFLTAGKRLFHYSDCDLLQKGIVFVIVFAILFAREQTLGGHRSNPLLLALLRLPSCFQRSSPSLPPMLVFV